MHHDVSGRHSTSESAFAPLPLIEGSAPRASGPVVSADTVSAYFNPQGRWTTAPLTCAGATTMITRSRSTMTQSNEPTSRRRWLSLRRRWRPCRRQLLRRCPCRLRCPTRRRLPGRHRLPSRCRLRCRHPRSRPVIPMRPQRKRHRKPRAQAPEDPSSMTGEAGHAHLALSALGGLDMVNKACTQAFTGRGNPHAGHAPGALSSLARE